MFDDLKTTGQAQSGIAGRATSPLTTESSKTMDSGAELWRFVATCNQADRVFLVKECDGQASVWIEMQCDGGGQWTTTDRLVPGRYRVRYVIGEGRSFYNCGTSGLSGDRLSEKRHGVHMDWLPMPL